MKKSRTIILVTIPLLLSMGIILAATYIRGIAPFFSAKIVQIIAYLLILLIAFIFIKLSGKSLREIGLFRSHLVRQIIVGVIIAGIFLIVAGIFTGWHFFSKVDSIYFLLSQILVAFSEELLFRGYLLAMFKDIAKTPDRAVIISALIFGLWHYPISHNIGLVLITFFAGAVYGTLRTVFEKTDDEIGLVSLTIAHWAFNSIL